MKKLVLELTNAQFRRIAIAAALLHATPEQFVVGATLGELDSSDAEWEEHEPFLDRVTTVYGERRAAFEGRRDQPIEETATLRRLTAAKRSVAKTYGLKLEVSHA